MTRRSVEAGNYVEVGQELLAIVPKNVWVTANYKETQLVLMRTRSARVGHGGFISRSRIASACRQHSSGKRDRV